MTSDKYPGKVALQQRVIPSYRALFIDTFAGACQGGLSVFAGEPRAAEGINPVENLQIAQYARSRNWYFGDPSSPLFLCWQSGFTDWLQAWQPDVLIVEANPRYMATHQAIAWMHRRGRKVIGWGLGAPPVTGAFTRLRLWERSTFLHSLDAVIAYSQLGAEQYRQMGFSPTQIYVAPNAVAKSPSSPPPSRPIPFPGKPTILFVGRLQPRKRVGLLLRACSAISAEKQPNVIIVGDGPARSELELLAHQIYPQAQFVGAKQGSEVESYFLNADLFVLPGTGGLAIQQAMAHALPVIVARGDGTQDDLVRSENGWQVPPDDLEALTQTLHQALTDPVALRRMGNASYRIVAEEINVNKMVEVFIRALKDLA